MKTALKFPFVYGLFSASRFLTGHPKSTARAVATVPELRIQVPGAFRTSTSQGCASLRCTGICLQILVASLPLSRTALFWFLYHELISFFLSLSIKVDRRLCVYIYTYAYSCYTCTYICVSIHMCIYIHIRVWM